MVSDGARKTQAVVRMYHNSVFLGDTTFKLRDWSSRLYYFLMPRTVLYGTN